MANESGLDGFKRKNKDKASVRKNNLMVFSGNANKKLATDICAKIGIPLSKADVRKFSDGETFVEIGENVRGKDVFVVQPTCTPVNDNLMELVLMVDALRRASARRITAVVVYYGYARQDRKVRPRVPISAKVVAEMLMAVGTRRVLTMDLHAGQIQGFFNIPVDNLWAKPMLVKDIQKRFSGKNSKNVLMVSPDAGGTERARSYAKDLGFDLALIDKRREKENKSEVMNIIGKVRGKICIMLDDMVDTAGTLCNAADALVKAGAKEVHAYASHGVLSGPAIDRICKSDIASLTVTDSIPLNGAAGKCGKIKIISVAELIGQAILRINKEDSVSSLFAI